MVHHFDDTIPFFHEKRSVRHIVNVCYNIVGAFNFFDILLKASLARTSVGNTSRNFNLTQLCEVTSDLILDCNVIHSSTAAVMNLFGISGRNEVCQCLDGSLFSIGLLVASLEVNLPKVAYIIITRVLDQEPIDV